MEVHHIPGRTVRCGRCSTTFTFLVRDVMNELNMWGGLALSTLRCPNALCGEELILKDNRFFLFRFISWVERWYGRAIPIKNSKPA